MPGVGEGSGLESGATNRRKRKKTYDTKEAVDAREKELAKGRAAQKKDLRARFTAYRDRLEERNQWSGPRKFERWLRGVGERELGDAEAAEATPMPLVRWLLCLHIDHVCLQKWKCYVHGLESLADMLLKWAGADQDLHNRLQGYIEANHAVLTTPSSIQ